MKDPNPIQLKINGKIFVHRKNVNTLLWSWSDMKLKRDNSKWCVKTHLVCTYFCDIQHGWGGNNWDRKGYQQSTAEVHIPFLYAMFFRIYLLTPWRPVLCQQEWLSATDWQTGYRYSRWLILRRNLLMYRISRKCRFLAVPKSICVFLFNIQ